MRFEWKFAIAAIIANLHDIVIVVGIFAVMNWEFSLPVLAAVLAVLGYSVNESVIIFDRVREHFRKMRRTETVEVINSAITATISRTCDHARLDTRDDACDVLLRWSGASLLRVGADDWYSSRRLLVGVRGSCHCHVPLA